MKPTNIEKRISSAHLKEWKSANFENRSAIYTKKKKMKKNARTWQYSWWWCFLYISFCDVFSILNAHIETINGKASGHSSQRWRKKWSFDQHAHTHPHIQENEITLCLFETICRNWSSHTYGLLKQFFDLLHIYL